MSWDKFQNLGQAKSRQSGTGLQWETLEKILYRIEAVLRFEGTHDEREIDSMMSQARYVISRSYFGEYKPKGKR